MSKLDELIKELCPDGVEYREIGELGKFYGGLSGKSKSDFTDGNAKFITYMNIFSNLDLNIDVDTKVNIGKNEKQNTIQFGDILFTGSSETPDECGMSSVLTRETEEPLYLNSFCFGFRLNENELLVPDFSKYLFRSEELRKQIKRTANGVTRFNVSKKKMEKVRIPIPPLSVQQEIVRILDKFTSLEAEFEAELEAELEARRKQYEFYRDTLLINNPNSTQVKVKDVTKDRFWIMPATPNFISEKGVPYITSKNIRKGKILFENVKYISEEDYSAISNNRPIIENDILISMIGTLGEIAIVSANDLFFYGQNMFLLRLDEKIISIRYFYHFFDTKVMKEYFNSIKNASSQGYLRAQHIEDVIIPLQSLEEQERIISVLDRFDALVNDISKGLPAEIEARRKQYEYYRDKLLTFEEKIS